MPGSIRPIVAKTAITSPTCLCRQAKELLRAASAI